MAREHINIHPVLYIKANGKMVYTMDKAHMNSQMVVIILANGKSKKCMDKDFILILKERNGKEYSLMACFNLKPKENYVYKE